LRKKGPKKKKILEAVKAIPLEGKTKKKKGKLIEFGAKMLLFSGGGGPNFMPPGRHDRFREKRGWSNGGSAL